MRTDLFTTLFQCAEHPPSHWKLAVSKYSPLQVICTGIVACLAFHSCSVASARAESTPQEALNDLVLQVKNDIHPKLLSTLRQPDGPLRLPTVLKTKVAIEKLRGLPEPPALTYVDSADRYRYIAFLELLIARVEGERIGKHPGIDSKQKRLPYATQALKDIEKARMQTVDAGKPGPGYDKQMLAWMKEDGLEGHLLNLAANAHGIIWEITKSESEKTDAGKFWLEASKTDYGEANPDPGPELAKALGIIDPPNMLTMLWVGLALMALMVVLAVFIPNPTSFQMYVFRVVTALGAGGIGAYLPGPIGFQSTYVTAGGAAAFFAAIYMINPPKLARKLAGNEPV